ncbi:MAG: hypothetical protein R3265_17470, partial [Hyphomonas sp.]|nr:hypothetical protein [Hyphomonas sp.]
MASRKRRSSSCRAIPTARTASPAGVSEKWIAHLHGFEWLRDLKALGGDLSRLQGRNMIESWIRHYQACKPEI